MPEDMIALRCKYCGAPLSADSVKGDDPYVTCDSCGTTQQKVDAKAYIDQLMGQVRSWINQAIPGGAAVATSSSVDAVARHNIYVTNVQPRIDSEFGDYKFGLISMLSHTMMVMPFSVDTSLHPQHTSTKAFEFGAKLKEVSPLAVTDDTAESLQEAAGATDAYAVLINNSKLLAEDKEGRYVLMANNFATAAGDFSKMKGYEPAALRFEGLALLCQGCDSLLNGDAATAYGKFTAGKQKLEEASAKLVGNLKLPVMGPALKNETKMAEALIRLADYMNSAGGSKQVFDAVRKIMSYRYPSSGNWGYMLQSSNRTGAILENMALVARACSGEGVIDVVAGPGDILVPFWHVKLNYSFQTGSLWKKTAKTVSEDLLVIADFPIDGGCLNNPASAVTDVFANADSAGFMDKISGNQSSISNSAGIANLVNGAGTSSAGGRKVIVPLSLKNEAEKMAELYLQSTAGRNKQLKLSNPDVVRMVYVPMRISGDGIAPSDGSVMMPQRIGRVKLSDLVVL